MRFARLRRSTFGLVALVAALFAVATVAIGGIAYEVTHEALELQLDHRIAAETRSLLAEGQGAPRGIAEAIHRREQARSTSSLDYLLVLDGGTVAAATMAADVPAKPGYEELLAYRQGVTEGIAQALTTRVPGATLVVAADRGDLDEIDRTLMLLFAAALAAMLLLGIAAAALIGGLTRRRLARIDSTALAIIGGDLSRRVPSDGSASEFDRLAVTLNRMLDRIEGLMTNLRQVSSDIAHDLRTPLTRLQNRLEEAMAEGEGQARTHAIEAAHAQAGELLEIFAALLRIAEIEGMAERLPREPLDLSALVEQMAETYRPDIEASGRVLHADIEPGLTIRGDRRLLNQALANLLDNALRHTPAGTRITVSAKAQGMTADVTVADNAPAIDLAQPERLFQRFARGERARSSPGHGLGLALVVAILMAHDGRATLRVEAGFCVKLRLPLKDGGEHET